MRRKQLLTGEKQRPLETEQAKQYSSLLEVKAGVCGIYVVKHGTFQAQLSILPHLTSSQLLTAWWWLVSRTGERSGENLPFLCLVCMEPCGAGAGKQKNYHSHLAPVCQKLYCLPVAIWRAASYLWRLSGSSSLLFLHCFRRYTTNMEERGAFSP